MGARLASQSQHWGDRRIGLWLVLVTAAACSGCFSGDYNRRMEQTISSLKAQGERAASVFGQASPVYTAAGQNTGISLHFPVFIDDKAKSLTANDPQAQPPFADLPGIAYAFEVTLGDQPTYAYFAAVKADEKPTDVLEQQVLAAVGKTFSGAAWQDVTVERIQGGSITLRRLSVSGNQKFGSQVEDGRFDLYLVNSATYHVLIGWRAPVAVTDSADFFDKASISMGTVQGNS